MASLNTIIKEALDNNECVYGLSDPTHKILSKKQFQEYRETHEITPVFSEFDVRGHYEDYIRQDLIKRDDFDLFESLLIEYMKHHLTVVESQIS